MVPFISLSVVDFFGLRSLIGHYFGGKSYIVDVFTVLVSNIDCLMTRFISNILIIKLLLQELDVFLLLSSYLIGLLELSLEIMRPYGIIYLLALA